MTAKFLTRAEVCDIVGVSYPTLWDKIRKKQFPAGIYLFDGVLRWKRDEVESWLAARTGPKAKRQVLLGMPNHVPPPGKQRGRKSKSASASV